MGYYTKYQLDFKILDNSTDTAEVIRLALIEAFEFLDEVELESYDVKWYEHEEELKQFSINYPNVLFILTGIGEESYFIGNLLSADIWIKYFFNGKSYTDKLEHKFPEFNRDKLC